MRLITANWDTIKDAATALYNWVRDKLQALADFVSGLVGGIADSARRIGDAIKGPINTVIHAWNGLEFTVPEVNIGPVHFGGQTIGTPNISTLEHGGYVSRTGLAIVHAGEQFSGVGRSFGATTVNINVTSTGLGADAPAIQRAVVARCAATTHVTGRSISLLERCASAYVDARHGMAERYGGRRELAGMGRLRAPMATCRHRRGRQLPYGYAP